MNRLLKLLIAMAGAPLVPLCLLAALIRLPSLRRQLAAAPVLIYSQVIWDEVWQRPQQYAWRTARQHPVIYCCPVQLHNLLTLRRRWRPWINIADAERDIIILSPLVFSGHFKSRLIHEINSLIISWYIRLTLPHGARPHVMINTPLGLPVLQRLFLGPAPLPKARLVYDVIDDFTIFDWSPNFSRQFDHELTARADRVIAGTHELADSRANAVFIPCGVDFEMFAADSPPPADLRDLPRPIIGYFGTISERIDLPLIARLGEAFPQASVLLIGPVHLNLSELPRLPNIHYLGLRPHGELPAYARRFDVALIPFRLTPATLKLNPVKTLEYLAAGLPVVSTRIPDVARFYSHIVHIADSHDHFVSEVSSILSRPDLGRYSRGVDLARQASWHTMTEKMNEALLLDPPCES